jgi:hypothetical protein
MCSRGSTRREAAPGGTVDVGPGPISNLRMSGDAAAYQNNPTLADAGALGGAKAGVAKLKR